MAHVALILAAGLRLFTLGNYHPRFPFPAAASFIQLDGNHAHLRSLAWCDLGLRALGRTAGSGFGNAQSLVHSEALALASQDRSCAERLEYVFASFDSGLGPAVLGLS